MPDPSTRDLYDEIGTLRQELADALNVGEHNEPCPHDNPAPTWQGGRCVKPRGHEVHWNGQGDVWVADVEALVRERDRLREAVRRLLDLYDSGNVLGTIAEIPALRDALDGGT